MVRTFPFAINHPLDQLFLDPNNPRLPASLQRDEETIIKYLSHHAAIEDLVSSIGENGFFFAEALVAIPMAEIDASGIDEGVPLVVVEGNRRLTALKLLADPENAERKALKALCEAADHKPQNIPVIVYESRESVLQFLGYRHITGVKPWDPMAKARYIQQLFERLPAEDSFMDRYREVAQIVGSKLQYIRRSLNALAAIDIADQNEFFDLDIKSEDIEFSLILTALGYSEIQKWVLNESDDLENHHLFEQQNRVNVENLAKLFAWMFEVGKSGATRLGESRNIKRLAAIVSTPRAMERFESGATIESAYLASKGSDDEFLQFLREADDNLKEASQLIAYVDFRDIFLDMANSLFKQSKHVQRSLESKRDEE